MKRNKDNLRETIMIEMTAWIFVIGVFISSTPDVFLLSALVLFKFSGYIEDAFLQFERPLWVGKVYTNYIKVLIYENIAKTLTRCL